MTDSSFGIQSPAASVSAESAQTPPESHPAKYLADQREATARLASEFLAGQKEPAGGADGLKRAATVLAGGLKDGIADSAENSFNLNTAKTVVESLGIGYGLGALARVGPIGRGLAVAGGAVMGGEWIYSEVQRGRPQATLRAIADAYNSKDNIVQDRQIVATNGGALAFETGLALIAGGVGMKKGLDLKENWHMQAAARARSTYSGAVNFLASDGRAHGAHVLGSGDLGLGFAGKDLLAPTGQPALPGFSEGTAKILAGRSKTLSDRIDGNTYDSTGLPAQHGYTPSGVRDLVPFSKAGEILDPAASTPKTVASFTDLAGIFNAKQRVKLADGDPVAQILRQNVVDGAAQGRALIAEGQRLQLAQDTLIKPYDAYYDHDLKQYAFEVVSAEKRLTDIQAQAREISALRLESARITLKLKKMGEAEGGETTADTLLKTHLQQQKDLLQDEIVRRNKQVGSVKDPQSPIARAKDRLETAQFEAEDWFLFHDSSRQTANIDWSDGMKYHARQASDLVASQRAIDANAEAQKDMAVRFSESVHAYQARLDALQNPAGTTAGTAVIPSTNRTESGSMLPSSRPAVAVERMPAKLDRAPAPKEARVPPIDAKSAATDYVTGSLRAALRERAAASLSTQTLQESGALDQAGNRLYDNSTVAFFQSGKPVSILGNDQKPHMALFDLRNYNQRLAQMPDLRADGFAVLSPVLEANGSISVLRQQPLGSGRGTRPVYKKEVVAVGGNVPQSIQQGTGFGKLFSLFSGSKG